MAMSTKAIREYFSCYMGDVTVAVEVEKFNDFDIWGAGKAVDLELGREYTISCKSTGKSVVLDSCQIDRARLETVEEEICN